MYSPDGNKLAEIEVPEPPSNVCFGGAERRTLFITARKGFAQEKVAAEQRQVRVHAAASDTLSFGHPWQVKRNLVRQQLPGYLSKSDCTKVGSRKTGESGVLLAMSFKALDARLRRELYGEDPTDANEKGRRSAQVGRKLAMLRAHGILEKVPKGHRYRVTSKGRHVLTVFLAAANAAANELLKLAA